MRYFVTDGHPGEPIVLELDPRPGADGCYRIRLGEREVRVEPVLRGAGELSLRMNGGVSEVVCERGASPHGVIVDDGDHRHELLVETELERLEAEIAGPGGAAGGAVRSVMPGIVVEVLIGEGDVVEAGQALLILEAMKMENEVPATGRGRVSRLHVQPGETVEGGPLLVELEEA